MADYEAARWDDGVQSRFWSKVEKAANGCWLWKSTITPQGYGQFSIDNKHFASHRLLFIKSGNAIQKEDCCDHLCRNRACVNPSHIEAVSNAENIRRGIIGDVNAAKGALVTQCRKGHPYTPENTRYNKRGTRNCRECDRINGKRHTAARVARRRAARAHQGAAHVEQ